MKLIQDFLPEGLPCDTKSFFKEGEADSYTIHWIGAYPGQSPQDVRAWWETSAGEASAHFIIKDDLCLQCLPLWKTAYHTGNLVGNKTSIGIEVIPKNSKGEFSQKSIETLKELFFLLPVKPILRHFDWSGKECPKFYIDDDKWEQLKLAFSPKMD